jgi:predicted RNA-binding protein with PUA-like domain
MKTEPKVFSYDDLQKAPKQTSPWDGVRNYQARNFMRDDFKSGDLVFVYHSSCDVPGVVGIAEVVREAYEDPSAMNSKSPYFDEKAKKRGDNPWVMVDVKAKTEFSKQVTLGWMRENKKLADMMLLKRGQRLSIQPLTKTQWDVIANEGSSTA